MAKTTVRERRDEKKKLVKDLRKLARVLKRLREEAGLSKRAMAGRMGVSPTVLVRIEEGQIKRKPSVEQLQKMADALAAVAPEFGDEFREEIGLIAPEDQELFGRLGQFVSILKECGLTEDEVANVMTQATEDKIHTVLSGEDTFDVKRRPSAVSMLVQEEAKPDNRKKKVSLDELSAAIAVDQKTRQPGRVSADRLIDAGDAMIVLKRDIGPKEKAALEGIARAVAELLKSTK